MNHNPSDRLRPYVPKDGTGPHGVPQIYYTSRTLKSTFRYVRFVKKLRQIEEEISRGVAIAAKSAVDKQTLEFFNRCDRRGLIKDVAHRVDLCMQSYNIDLDKKRKRLIELLTADEQANILAFVEQTQAGVKATWDEKQKRLEYLLDKRRKEHEAKFKETPLSKSAHVLPCIYKIRAKEAEEFQLYQMQEKQMRKMADAETDKMWYDVAMKESEALAARLELDAMERSRREAECRQYSDYQLEMRRQQRDREREQLKLESMKAKAEWQEQNLKEAEDDRKHQESRRQLAQERQDMIRERKETIAKLEADAKLITDTWDSLAGQGKADEKIKEEIRRQKERDLDECNRKMAEMKHCIAKTKFDNEPLIMAEGQRIQDAADLKRCLHRKWSVNTNKEVRAVMQQQMKDKQAIQENEQKSKADAEELQRQLEAQLEQLVKHKQLTSAQAMKLYHRDLHDQIQYNKSLKERAKQEAIEETKKGEIAAKEYLQEMAKMMQRPMFSDQVHPFMKQMTSGLKMKTKCLCSLPDYCLD